MAKILLIEDEPNQRVLYRMELEDEGYDVIVASNGLEGLREVKEKQPDLVVLDLRMPGMDGVETLGQAMSLNNRLPVIIHSAYETFKDNFMTWLADAYVVKSSNLDILKEEIQRVLMARKGERAQAWPEGTDDGNLPAQRS